MANQKEGEMETDIETRKLKELEDMKKRLKEMEEEAASLRALQAKLENQMTSADQAATQASREEADSRSVFVGNVHSSSFQLSEELGLGIVT
ncbi:hypothetical protein AQUCO_01000151v1 [Aquilegia coerulea]|uniref:Uncharacterized protein n=1 Tax=Aquilegia coerulea TaxID=218851 RepID=A0A2G5E8H9_AQUCA|nr:hypothetical protein AQUCO_01000151v1 [Aquilegia coerulea]